MSRRVRAGGVDGTSGHGPDIYSSHARIPSPVASPSDEL